MTKTVAVQILMDLAVLYETELLRLSATKLLVSCRLNNKVGKIKLVLFLLLLIIKHMMLFFCLFFLSPVAFFFFFLKPTFTKSVNNSGVDSKLLQSCLVLQTRTVIVTLQSL